ncbi:MAG: DUF3570 domain-containing protein [Gammaproteobacteria bacterium]|nr:DUF3570 domain-containing protein [Gammaproteobacteria bacterium]MCW8922263.1 DUF3570 domain-containing protein [Gammaproteobacteria bacterium]
MQLKKIKGQMAVATCALLQAASPAANAAEAEWDVDTSLLYYSEADGRVQAAEPAIHAGRDLGDDERIDFRVVFDALTGATPNGGYATSAAQTFTTPSGDSTYVTAAGDSPLDDTFRDARVSLGADWTMSLDRMSKVVWGASLSGEIDYISMGLTAAYSQDFNNRNTTLTASLGFNNDIINPYDGVPIEFSPMRVANTGINRDGDSETKTITDFMIGVTQVVNRKTLIQLNLSLSLVDGYQNDPYKIMTVVDDPVTGLPASSFLTADDLSYVYEKRPDSRQKNILFFKAVHHLEEDVINFSYRYYSDDWGIKSHTLDLKYRYELANSYLQPHVRYYTQDAADFYRHNLVLGTDIDTAGNALIDYASHDYRLAELDTVTLGLKYGIPMGDDSEFSVRGEVISQSVNDSGVPAGQETPDLDALMLQVNYSFLW